MLTVKVLKNFNDRETGAFRRAGDEVRYSDARAEELEAGGWVEIYTPQESVKPVKKTAKK